MSYNQYVFCFGPSGFYEIVNLTEHREVEVMAKLSDTPAETSAGLLHHMMIRKNFRDSRAEIWVTEISQEFTEEDLFKIAMESPQDLADIARTGRRLDNVGTFCSNNLG